MHSWLLILSVHKVKYNAGSHRPVKQANLLFALINTLYTFINVIYIYGKIILIKLFLDISNKSVVLVYLIKT